MQYVVDSVRWVSVISNMCNLCCFMYCVSCKGLVAERMFWTFHCPMWSVLACSRVRCALHRLLGLMLVGESVGWRMWDARCARLGGRVGCVLGAFWLGVDCLFEYLFGCLLACCC